MFWVFCNHCQNGKPQGKMELQLIYMSLLVWCCYKSICCVQQKFAGQHFPTAWKEALVVPVYKKGNRSQLINYCPIALLSAVGKVCEQLVQVQLQKLLSTYLSDNQSGFRKGDSTSHQLFRLAQTWSDALDSRKLVGVVFFDLAKIFEKVPHRALLAKLEAVGLRGGALHWITSYLSNRTQQTRVGSCVSEPAEILSGVPQGAILSPLLFTVYANDIFKYSSSSVNLFADDTSSFIIDSSRKCLAIHLQLQAEVENLSAWFSKWLLSVNVHKSAMLVLSSRSKHPERLSIRIGDSVIPQVCHYKHLGVTLSESLSWSAHIDAICSKTAQRIGLICRHGSRQPKIVIQRMYTACVRPAMEYSSVAWFGLSLGNAEHLEHIQRRAAGLIVGEQPRSTTPHDLLLCRAGLPTLFSRLNITLCLLAYDFVHHRLPPPPPPPPHCMNAFQAWGPTKSARSTSLRPHINKLIQL